MKLPLSWLNEFVKINDVPVEDLKNKLFSCGFEVEDVIYTNKDVHGIVVCQINSIEQHPNADKLSVCQVNAGEYGCLRIVTNAKNIAVGDKVPVSIDGAVLADGTKIKKGKLRGVDSDGMFCGGEEIGITEEYYDGAGNNSVLVFHDDFPLGADVCELLQAKEIIFDIGVTANRPDCQSVIGLAREVAAVLGREFVAPSLEYTVNEEDRPCPVSVEVRDPVLCPRYMAQYIENVVIKPSPKWMQRRLALAGFRAINNIVDITNYILYEMGQPMHAFDCSTIGGQSIIVRRAENGEKITTLDDKEFALTSDNLVICDADKPVALAGIMGGKNSGINDELSSVLFECAKFKRDNIRKTSRSLGQRSDSSARYEKGVDAYTTAMALKRALHLVYSTESGTIVGKTVDVLNENLENKVISTSFKAINKVLGIEVPQDIQVKILENLSFEINVKDDGTFDAIVPLYREDVEGAADLAEEIIRTYGYDHIVCRLLDDASITDGGKTKAQRDIDLTKTLLVGQGYNEIVTYSFVSEKDFEIYGNGNDKYIKLFNPLGEDMSVMRTMLIPSMVSIVARNLNKKNLEGKLFELAKIYLPEKLPLETLPDERNTLCMSTFGDNSDFFALKGDIEQLLEQLHFNGDLSYEKADKSYLHPGRSAVIKSGEQVIGLIGELHPSLANKLGIDKRVCVAQLDYSYIAQCLNAKTIYKAISKFPSVERDLALVADFATPNAFIEKLIKERGGKNLIDVKLFDVYTGKGVDEGKKSMAYRLTFSSLDKTFGEGEVDSFIKKILHHLNENSITLR